MARRTHPRKDNAHKLVAAEVLRSHAMKTGKPIELPVPIEMIVEVTYQLSVEWETSTSPRITGSSARSHRPPARSS